MIESTRQELDRRLRINEGERFTAYYDTANPPCLTIGVGFNLQRADAVTVGQVLKAAGIVCPWSLEAFKKLSLTQEQVDALLDHDVPNYIAAARRSLVNDLFDTMTPARQIAITDMTYNLGEAGWLGFVTTRTLIESGQTCKNQGTSSAHDYFVQAGEHLAASAWYSQVGDRAKRNVAMIVTGQLCSATGDGSDVS
jgi:hypothetical protein